MGGRSSLARKDLAPMSLIPRKRHSVDLILEKNYSLIGLSSTIEIYNKKRESALVNRNSIVMQTVIRRALILQKLARRT